MFDRYTTGPRTESILGCGSRIVNLTGPCAPPGGLPLLFFNQEALARGCGLLSLG